jgi:hypothetical protein
MEPAVRSKKGALTSDRVPRPKKTPAFSSNGEEVTDAIALNLDKRCKRLCLENVGRLTQDQKGRLRGLLVVSDVPSALALIDIPPFCPTQEDEERKQRLENARKEKQNTKRSAATASSPSKRKGGTIKKADSLLLTKLERLPVQHGRSGSYSSNGLHEEPLHPMCDETNVDDVSVQVEDMLTYGGDQEKRTEASEDSFPVDFISVGTDYFSEHFTKKNLSLSSTCSASFGSLSL